MHFSRLRLSGFKSFVDPTELHIEPGLTGVVGPNGCGKSNLLEAIRWVMGENRVKSLRGAEMDDVIFSGTDKRPPRNMAEVSLVLDNLERNAPSGYNDHDMIEVSRRIERDSGSAYRINGRDVRAKDVQLLFADAATGAHSPALVSQGRIGALISAKPQDRRQLLEEAAGISGLHSRRKEAEQRLRAAEKNLTRLQDVVGQMETQVASLKRQARQATRYREISGDIRKAEASLLYLKWDAASQEVVKLENQLHDAKILVSKATETVTEVTTAQTEFAAKIPALRNKDVETAAMVQRLTIARDTLNNEESRRNSLIEELKGRLGQIDADKQREQENKEDSKAALERLMKEQARLEALRDSEKETEDTAQKTLENAAREASAAEENFDALSQKTASIRARKESLSSDVLAIERRLDMLSGERARLTAEIAALESEAGADEERLTAEKTVKTSAQALLEATKAFEAAEILTKNSRIALENAQSALSEKRGGLVAMEAEVAALKALLAKDESADDAPISKDLKVEKGYEKATGAAFGDDIEAGENVSKPRFWQRLAALASPPKWPTGVEPLSNFVKAPAALTRRLAAIGVIMDDGADGTSMAENLSVGLCLVNKAGDVWRWDGYVTRGQAPSQAAIRFEQSNRLADLEKSLTKAQADIDTVKARLEAAEKTDEDARATEQKARHYRDESEQAAVAAQRALVAVEQKNSQKSSRLSTLKEADERLSGEVNDTKLRLDAIQKELGDLPDLAVSDASLAKERARVEGLRVALAEARSAYDGLRREAQARTERLQAINSEKSAWQMRFDGATKQLQALDARVGETNQQLKTLLDGPDNIEAKRQALLNELEQAEQARKETSDALLLAEQALAAKDTEMRTAQNALNEVREKLIRLDAGVEAAVERRKEIAHQVGERFECPPSHVLEKVGIDTADDLPSPSAAEVSLERLKRERERLGAVNLRAEEELEEINQQIGHMISEKSDLEEAIARLRGAINGLNKEGRERLLAAFDNVNKHFESLFKSLFGGGEAHLKLTESDDPLEAGLEIFASPPGKKMQSLSLLSGGEQALTATSLIFAVFITNPAPICVLDEVDAPLDDANVERFCDLLDEMRRRTNTRFLIVTHNALTMSRMSRLFGVTMAERGASQLVSVDLEQAAEISEAS